MRHLVLILLLAGCGSELPDERLTYANYWASPEVMLHIGSDGMVEYRRQAGSGEVMLDGPIRAFHGDDFEVGLPVLNTMFQVEKRPWHDGERWRMVVDGRELVGCPDGDCGGQWASGLEVEILGGGILGPVKPDGSRAIAEEGPVIPLSRVGEFGVLFRLHDAARSAHTLTFRWEGPPACEVDTGEMKGVWVLDGYTAADEVEWAAFELLEECERVPGPWTLRISYGARQLAQANFLVEAN